MPFPTTNWSALAKATLSGDAAGREALDSLCQTYRAPVVAFLRSRGFGENEAQDLTQEFFLRLLESRAWKRADRRRGRFRTFLLGALMHVLAHVRERETAGKRGSGLEAASLDELCAAGAEPSIAPEEARTFDREWALRLTEDALTAVEHSFAEAGRAHEWAVLERFLPGVGEPPTYESAAAELDLSLPALKTAVHRVRRRFRESLRAAVAQTVSAAHEIDEELAYLHHVLASHAG